LLSVNSAKELLRADEILRSLRSLGMTVRIVYKFEAVSPARKGVLAAHLTDSFRFTPLTNASWVTARSSPQMRISAMMP
jgi:hypothetical protein